MSSDIFNFARSRASGQMVDVSMVERGLACECVCSECHKPVLARKGEKNRHGFAHYGVGNCGRGGEGGLHRAARQVLAQAAEVALPQVADVRRRFAVATASQPDEGGWPHATRRPDVVWCSSDGETIHVEVTVRHGIDTDKLADIEARGIATLEYDLSHLTPETDLSLERLREVLLDDGNLVHWVFHPALPTRAARENRSREAIVEALRREIASLPPPPPKRQMNQEEAARIANLKALLEGRVPTPPPPPPEPPTQIAQFRLPMTRAYVFKDMHVPGACVVRWSFSQSLYNAELTRRGEAVGLTCYYLHCVELRRLCGQDAEKTTVAILEAMVRQFGGEREPFSREVARQ